MIRYQISYDNPLSHFIKVKLCFDAESKESELKLPAWRPGRYQVQNFAKNLKNLVISQNGKTLVCEKTSKDSWKLVHEAGEVCVTYEYYAFQMDAGSSWLDEEQLYLNFINFAMYLPGQMHSKHQVKIEVPGHYKVATGLKEVAPLTYECASFYELVDSPLMASPTLRQVSYTVEGHDFHIWIQGELPQSDEALIADFEPFTRKQMAVMGGFPCHAYHFLVQSLPYKHYHGVEHLNSTVITMGPSAELAERKLYKEFLGVSCHELFHTWNVIRIRPAEMSPYDFSAENYHETGFVTEGVTTYYGDLFLARSGVFSQEEYLEEINKMLKRHYGNEGRKHYSVASSSYDLWLDGYERGIPGRKVSIYNEGALAAMILDLKIRLKYDHEKSLDDVMRLMWQRHQWKDGGYTYADYQKAAEEVYGADLSPYFDGIISGTQPFEELLAGLFESCGLSFEKVTPEKREEQDFGIRLISYKERHVIDDIAPGSPAEKVLSRKDEILKLNGQNFDGAWPSAKEGSVHLQINRFGRSVEVTLEKGEGSFFSIYQVAVNENASHTQKQHLTRWFQS